MKNFPGYTPVSRTIVPRDLAGNPHDLWVKATIDGEFPIEFHLPAGDHADVGTLRVNP